MKANELKPQDNLLVIKESDLDYILSKARMSGSAKIMFKDRTFPASEVFEAAREIEGDETFFMDKYPTYTDYEKTKI